MAILDVLEEMILYKQIEDILPIIGYNSCHEKEKCTNLVHIKPTDMYISFAYPSMKFTFSYPDIKPGGSYYTFSFHLKRNIDCRFLLEGKERFTRRSVIWNQDISDQADFVFSGNSNPSVYEFALSISRTEHSEEDKQRDCVNYPTKDYRTYADCDQDYVRRTLPSDLVPFWNVDNISQASSFWESEDAAIFKKAFMDTGFKIKAQKSF